MALKRLTNLRKTRVPYNLRDGKSLVLGPKGGADATSKAVDEDLFTDEIRGAEAARHIAIVSA